MGIDGQTVIRMKFRPLLLLLLAFAGTSSFTACKRYDPAGELAAQRKIAPYAYLELTSITDLVLKDLQGNNIFSSQPLGKNRLDEDTLKISFDRDRLMQYVDHLAGKLEVFKDTAVDLTGDQMHSLLVIEKLKQKNQNDDNTQPSNGTANANEKDDYTILLLEDNFDTDKDKSHFGIRMIVQKDLDLFASYPQYYVEARTKLIPNEENEGGEEQNETEGAGEDITHEPRYGEWQTLLDFSKDGRNDPITYQSKFVYFEPTDTLVIDKKDTTDTDSTQTNSTKKDSISYSLKHLEIALRNRATDQAKPVSQFILQLDAIKAEDLHLTIVLRPSINEDSDGDQASTDYTNFENYKISLFDHRYNTQ